MVQGNLAIRYSWDGGVIAQAECASISLRADSNALLVEIDAPYYADPAPAGEPGSLEGLWEFEVVELFLLGDGERYLELEFGPHGHYLALEFGALRVRSREGLALDYRCSQGASRWQGEARVPLGLLPAGLRACNAYAIHGCGEQRRYLACYPVRGESPDFHRLSKFGPLPRE